jgi:hypothetical protein
MNTKTGPHCGLFYSDKENWFLIKKINEKFKNEDYVGIFRIN